MIALDTQKVKISHAEALLNKKLQFDWLYATRYLFHDDDVVYKVNS